MKKSLFRATLSLALALLLSTSSFAADIHIEEEEIISTAHVFPVLPGTDAWNDLSPAERRASTYIPAEKISMMTTAALLETVLNYPYFVDLYAFDTLELAYARVSARFPALAELINRSDAVQTVSLFSDVELQSATTDYSRVWDLELLDDLIDLQSETTPIFPRYTPETVETPNGSDVDVYYNMSWLDHSLMYNYNGSNSKAERKTQEMLEAYPSTVLLASYSQKYNCHSYAWYSTSTSNMYWMPEPDMYIDDESYTSSTYVSGARVTYTVSGNIDHSAIVAYDGMSVSNVTVNSKWGVLGLFQHALEDCPYADGNNVIYEFWEM